MPQIPPISYDTDAPPPPPIGYVADHPEISLQSLIDISDPINGFVGPPSEHFSNLRPKKCSCIYSLP